MWCKAVNTGALIRNFIRAHTYKKYLYLAERKKIIKKNTKQNLHTNLREQKHLESTCFYIY